MREPTLKHTHIVKLSRLLDMLYKPTELAEEIGLSVDTIYKTYLPAGLPHIKDDNGIWIHGPAFVAWARETVSKKKSKRAGLPSEHAWCMKCNVPVQMSNPAIVHQNRYMEILQSTCPRCKTRINRARARQKTEGESNGQPSELA